MTVAPIDNDSTIARIVLQDHRAAGIFRKYNINYCCAGNITLQEACEVANVDINLVKRDLTNQLRVIQVSSSIDFNSWSIDFLIDYLVNIHHAYLVITMPEITDTVQKFVSGHQSKYPYLEKLLDAFQLLNTELLPHLEHEEKVIFPYIKQIAHAYEDREPYAALLVRTLRKSIETAMMHEHGHLEKYILQFRELTNNYTPPSGSCIMHKVALAKLKELDMDLVHHIYLENEILFPKAMQIEKELKGLNK